MTSRAAILFLFTAACFLISCDPKRQTADDSFDVTVARPAFSAQGPRVLFDEAHKNIHKADGLYEPFARLIRNDGYQISVNRATFSDEVLKDADILIIANALGPNESNDSSAFSPQECTAVRNWVTRGGSLLLITDHAPTGAAAEALASEFGIGMSKGFSEDSVHHDRSGGDASQLLFSRQNGLLGSHAITEGRDSTERVHTVMTFTGQSLRGPAGSAKILLLSPTAVNRPAVLRVEKEGGDVRVIIEYGDPEPAHDSAQGIAVRFGAGRVVVLGEAAMLTAQIDGRSKKPFGMNVPGVDNKQFVLNLMHWLARLTE